MDISCIEDIFNSEDAILLAGMSYQTYPFFEEGKLVLPKGFELRYTIRAIAGVTTPTEEVFGFIAESEDKIVIAFRGTDSSPDVDRIWTFFKYRILLSKMPVKPIAAAPVSTSQPGTP